MNNTDQLTGIRELNVYAHGDSSEISTWSNVPYLFTETLIKKGIKVNRIDINPRPLPEKFFNRYVWRVIRKLTGKDDFYGYIRTGMNHAEVKKRIAKAVKQYPNADAEIFISFSHSASHCSKKPSILFGDWTIAYHFDYFLEKKPGSLERASIRRQDEEIESAGLIISLFPGITRYLKNYYRNPNIQYIGNVVNRIWDEPSTDLPLSKKQSRNILFIGSRRYREGALQLVEAFRQLRGQGMDLQLHIIGMKKEDLSLSDHDIFAYGYLDKGDPAQRKQYYQLLQDARVIVNTTDKWGAFSSMVEAMYFYTPVITTPYNEFVETFGQQIPFGFYSAATVVSLKNCLENIFTATDYPAMCYSAHEQVKDFTWDNYIDQLLENIRKLPAFDQQKKDQTVPADRI